MRFVSPRAKISSALLIGDVTLLGPSSIGRGTIIMSGSVVGFPSRRKLLEIQRSFYASDEKSIQMLDLLSDGCNIGENCVIRTNCVIYELVNIGDNCELGHNVLVREETTIGNNTRIGSNTVIEGRVNIGSNVNIQSGVYIPREVIIEDNVFIGPYVVISNDKYPPSSRIVPVVIKKGAVLGAGSVILPGVTVGENAVVGAGSVVTRDVPPFTVVVGSPAKPMYTYDEYVRRRSRYERELA